MAGPLDLERPVLVYGLGVTGRAVARVLHGRGVAVVLADDRAGDEPDRLAGELGVPLHVAPARRELATLIDGVGLLVPSPGVPEGHPVIQTALEAGLDVRSELDLAAHWERERPFVAITGTDGKTTVTTMVTRILERSSRRAVAAGNTEVPLVAALDDDVDVFVVEASSFRLRFAECFRPAVATWLNFAEDHLDWHPSVAAYEAAKRRIWEHQRPGDVAVVNLDDDVVRRAARTAPGVVRTFSLDAATGADYARRGSTLVGPGGTTISEVGRLPRSLPHDLANALAASATALAAGATVDACGDVLADFEGLPHRVSRVAEIDGVTYYDDSKATAPHATLAALEGFASAVLIAGGRNKGLDLTVLREAAGHLRAVVAIGESADEIDAAFAGARPVVRAGSMSEAVRLAKALAEPGDAVVLSPGCASFDWYRSYAERGDDFVAAVGRLREEVA